VRALSWNAKDGLRTGSASLLPPEVRSLRRTKRGCALSRSASAPRGPVDTDTWPSGLKSIADVVGGDAALKIASEFGGVEGYYIPKRARANHPWGQLIGAASFRKPCEEFGGQRINVPRGTVHSTQEKAHPRTRQLRQDSVASQYRRSGRCVRRLREDRAPSRLPRNNRALKTKSLPKRFLGRRTVML
jgi:hypothetical protein